MIAAIRNQESRTEASANNPAFEAMLPAIRRTAQITFRKIRPELRDELIEASSAEFVGEFWLGEGAERVI